MRIVSTPGELLPMLAALALKPPPVLAARAFVLVDENEKPRAALRMDSGGPGLDLFDTEQHTRVSVSLLGRAGVVLFMDDQGTLRATFGMGVERPIFVLSAANGEAEIRGEVTADGPTLELCDSEGKAAVVLDLTAGAPGVGLLDSEGKLRATLNLVNGSPRLTLFDAAGEETYSAP
jgi:hypothetical protein